MHYINSTGISALIRYYELYRDRGGVLCLAGVAKSVGLSMHLLGVTSYLPFLADVETARDYVRRLLKGEEALPARLSGSSEADSDAQAGADTHAGTPDSSRGVSGASSAGATAAQRRTRSGLEALRRIPLRRRVPGLESCRVLVIAPAKGRFTRVLRLRFKTLNGDYHLIHDTQEALDRYAELAPDLIVLDDRADPKGEFVSRVKIQKDRSLTSIIKMYPKRTDVEETVDFKIWENDYLVEPFEVLELFSLTEAELCRVPKDKKVFQQQVHFEFKATRENIEKAYKLCDLVLRQSVVLQDHATALYAGVKEAIDNAVQHGNRSDPQKTVDMNILVDHRKITVIVEDQGEGFDYEYYLSRLNDDEAFDKARKRILEEGIRGGLGILLMSRCTDRLEYSGSGNIVRLEKNLQG